MELSCNQMIKVSQKRQRMKAAGVGFWQGVLFRPSWENGKDSVFFPCEKGTKPRYDL